MPAELTVRTTTPHDDDLFRREALDARRDEWLGTITLATAASASAASAPTIRLRTAHSRGVPRKIPLSTDIYMLQMRLGRRMLRVELAPVANCIVPK